MESGNNFVKIENISAKNGNSRGFRKLNNKIHIHKTSETSE